MKKKLLAVLIASVLIFVLTACSAGGSDVSGGLDGASNGYTDGDGNVIAGDGAEDEIGETNPKEEATDYKAVNVFEGVTLSVKEGSITPTGFTLILENENDTECQYGTFYCIERKNGDTWIKLPYVIEGDVSWNDVAHILPGKQSLEEAVNWNWLYGSLDEGEYRIIKEFIDFRATGDYDTYYLAAEFVIS